MDMLVIAEEHAFRDLELEPLGGKAGFAEDRPYPRRQRMELELNRRKVDRDTYVLRPSCSLLAGSSKDPLADFIDEADFLGERNEDDRADEAVLGMMPADQRLEAGYCFARCIDAR